MSSICKVIVIGNVGKNAEMRFTPQGKPVTSFSVATSNRYQKDGEWQEDTQWFTVVAWDKLAERCNQFVSKGQQVYVEGRLQLKEWEGKEGEKRYNLEIVASTVLFLGKKDKAKATELPEIEPDNLPF